MRIGINLFDFWSPGFRGEGVLNYVRGLVEGLAEIDRDNAYVLFLNPLNSNDFKGTPDNFEKFLVRLDPRKKWNRAFWEQFLLPKKARRFHLDVVHCPGGTASALFLSRCVATHHAANFFYYYRSRFRKHAFGVKQLYLAAMERYVIPRAAAVITVSEYSKQDIVGRLGANAGKVRVVYLTVPNGDDRLARDSSLELDFPYILDVTSSAFHKNVMGLISAYALLKQRVSLLPKLVISGAIPEEPGWGMHSRRELTQRASEVGLGEDLMVVPYPNRERLLALYRRAQLFVFTSLFEGFGLAPLEAMKYGIPVVLSNRASLPEVGGDAAIYIDPENPAEIADAIERVLSNPGLRNDLIERGLCQVESFGSWKRVARETLAVYEQVAAVQKHAADAAV